MQFLRFAVMVLLLPAITQCVQGGSATGSQFNAHPTSMALAGSTSETKPHPAMLRYPDVGPTHIVFVYADDLWLVPREGGQAVPLASPPGPERFPKFSPDGQTIAFGGNYEGNRDLYTIPVNGLELDSTKDPWATFQGLADKVVTLTVSEKPSIDEDARDIVVKTLSDEGGLRYRAWIEENRQYVDQKSDGRIGYIYVPNTSIGGQNDLIRQFHGQLNREALIIDERWNGGGQIPTRFIELLNRPTTNYWARRHGHDSRWPPDSHQGPKCMLINGLAGSGGDCFPYYFRQAGLGKLIGTRTWGGLVGLAGNPQLIDGGRMTAPAFAFYENDGTWGVEGHGVEPDIEVVDDPSQMTNGSDPQLDAAIEHLLAELERNPYVLPPRPRYPDRSGMGIREEDK